MCEGLSGGEKCYDTFKGKGERNFVSLRTWALGQEGNEMAFPELFGVFENNPGGNDCCS